MDVRANKRQGTNQPVVMDVNVETGRKLIWDPTGYLNSTLVIVETALSFHNYRLLTIRGDSGDEPTSQYT